MLNVEKAKERLAEQRPDASPEDGVTQQLAEAATTPRIIWTHLPLRLLHPGLLDTCRVVYVARNPKDVCVSFYHSLKNFGGRFFSGTFEGAVDAFINDNLFYGPYWDHIRQARRHKDHPNFHMMFYEDMKSNILEELRKLSTFLGLQLDDDMLLKISEYAQFDRMKSTHELKINVMNIVSNHCRKGRVGDWAAIATPEMDVKMERWIRDNSQDLDFAFRYK
ncbi:sulfotransferase 1C4-like [Penaeus japonicus]|uniref:sulfotransferase 1C4-like n=1 Tax=Penaeus japonicus TaxID=27405 RepID=UPI001C710A7B|nr:sulfotransferase 1C4-like [Penaeus japonicus]